MPSCAFLWQSVAVGLALFPAVSFCKNGGLMGRPLTLPVGWGRGGPQRSQAGDAGSARPAVTIKSGFGRNPRERNPRGQTLHIAQIRFSFIASPSRPSDDSKLLQRSWKRWPVSFRKRLNRRVKVACSHVTPSTKFACGVSNRQVIVIRHQAPSYSKRSLRAMVSSTTDFHPCAMCKV